MRKGYYEESFIGSVILLQSEEIEDDASERAIACQ
jgi:hypothetical protein